MGKNEGVVEAGRGGKMVAEEAGGNKRERKGEIRRREEGGRRESGNM